MTDLNRHLDVYAEDSDYARLNRHLEVYAEAGDLARVANLLALGADPYHSYSLPICRAASRGHAECVKLFLAAWKNSVFRSARGLGDALVLAAENGHAECVKLLIHACSPEAFNSEALREAAVNGHEECVKLLIPVSPLLSSDSNPFHQAIEEGQAGVIAIILSHEPALAGLIHLLDASDDARQANHHELAELFLSVHERLEIGDSLCDGSNLGRLPARRL